MCREFIESQLGVLMSALASTIPVALIVKFAWNFIGFFLVWLSRADIELTWTHHEDACLMIAIFVPLWIRFICTLNKPLP